jgi:hypothetical protein
MSRLPPKRFLAVKSDALKGYVEDDAGWWNQKIEKERQEAQTLREKNRRRTEKARQKLAEERASNVVPIRAGGCDE